MSSKIKARQQRMPKRRNMVVVDMINRGAPTDLSRNRKIRRPNDKRNSFLRDEE